MATIAGVDDVNLRRDMARDEMRRTALRMAHHEHVGVHGGQVVHGVEQGLALGWWTMSRYSG